MVWGTNTRTKVNDVVFNKTVILQFKIEFGVNWRRIVWLWVCLPDCKTSHLRKSRSIKNFMTFPTAVKMWRTSSANTCRVVDYLIIGSRYEGRCSVNVETWENRLNGILTAGPSKGRSICIREQTVNTGLYGQWAKLHISTSHCSWGWSQTHLPSLTALPCASVQTKQTAAWRNACPFHMMYQMNLFILRFGLRNRQLVT